MANYTVTVDERAAHKSLGAGAEDVVTFSEDVNLVEVVVHSGTAPVYFTVDNKSAVVGDGKAFALSFAGGSKMRVNVPGSGVGIVRLISAAVATYSVQNLDGVL